MKIMPLQETYCLSKRKKRMSKIFHEARIGLPSGCIPRLMGHTLPPSFFLDELLGDEVGLKVPFWTSEDYGLATTNLVT